MATDGTVKSCSYQTVCEEHGVDYVIPSEKSQASLMDIIYGCVKCAKAPDTDKFRAVAHELCDAGCDAIVLGCTELSLLDAAKICPECRFMDSLLVLAKISIVGFIREVFLPNQLLILVRNNCAPSPCKGHYPSRTTMEPPLPYPANEPDLGNPQLALCIG